MGKFIVNEMTGNFSRMPGANTEVEAESYEEQGSFTVFLDENQEQVLSMKTDKVRTIRRLTD